MNAFVIDAFEFCRAHEQCSGDVAVADLPRLAEETTDKTGMLHWSLQGGKDRHGHPQLTMSVTGPVKLMCQRCLTSFEFMIESHSVLVLAPDEASADAVESLIDDESIDVIAGSHAMNVLQLVEDEALLALPLSPRHETCPDRTVVDELKKDEKVSPFAVLKDFKRE